MVLVEDLADWALSAAGGNDMDEHAQRELEKLHERAVQACLRARKRPWGLTRAEQRALALQTVTKAVATAEEQDDEHADAIRWAALLMDRWTGAA